MVHPHLILPFSPFFTLFHADAGFTLTYQAMLNITMCFMFHGVTEDEVFVYCQTTTSNHNHTTNNHNNNNTTTNNNDNNGGGLVAAFGFPLSTNSTIPTSLSILRRSVPMQPGQGLGPASGQGLGPTYPDILTHCVVALVNENVEQVC